MNNFCPSYYLKAEITERTQANTRIHNIHRGKDHAARREAQVCSNAPEVVLARSEKCMRLAPPHYIQRRLHISDSPLMPRHLLCCAPAANFPQYFARTHALSSLAVNTNACIYIYVILHDKEHSRPEDNFEIIKNC